MARSIHSEEQLRQASDHLWYEVWMFDALAQGMASGIAGNGPINNALLESFAIHLRALIDFFYSESPRDDDIVAEDFFTPQNDWRHLRPAKTKVLERAKKRADKEIAHLTYTRIGLTPEQKNWHFIEVYRDVWVLIDIFLKNVSQGLLGSRWKNYRLKGK